jgi:mannose-6-phosphate isomerase
LLKILDANRDLSVQVHPNDTQASLLDPPDLGKTEAWLVMDVTPGSKIYAGLKAGVDRAAFAAAVADNRVEESLHSFEPAPGDCVFIPAGTLHAIGAGLLVAEIQQASDTTFRVYDWGRVDTDGQPRTLHIEQALDVIDFQTGPVHPISSKDAAAVTLVHCDKFKLQTYSFRETLKLSTEGGFLIMAVLSGAVHVKGDPQTVPLRRGDTLLIPAALETVEINPTEAAQIMIASP